jgi:YbgC/YbaW family acyl-CoA thioester hydrolase
MPISECRIRRRIAFHEVDSAGIVHFSWFYRYMEEAETALWRSAGLRLAPTMEFAYPRVAASFEFKKPLRFEDEAEVLIQVASIGRTSIGYRCVISLNGDVAAEGSMTVVCASGPPGEVRPTRVPDFIRERLAVPS